jgi:TIR domain.
MATIPSKAIKFFFSYSHQDQALRNKLAAQLSSLQREGLIAHWHDRKITAGSDWAKEIDTHLNTAQIILLLVSADFIASDYCYEKETTRVLERHHAGKARVIPIILRYCDWQHSPVGKLQALPTDGKLITGHDWHNEDEAFEKEYTKEEFLQAL